MIRPKFKLVRVLDEPFNPERLLKEVVERVKSNVSDGRVVNDNLGFGFEVELGNFKTLQNYLFPTSSMTPRANEEQVNIVRGLMNAKL